MQVVGGEDHHRVQPEAEQRVEVGHHRQRPVGVERLAGAILLEQHEEWHYGERRYLSETSLHKLLDTIHTNHPVNKPLPLTT